MITLSLFQTILICLSFVTLYAVAAMRTTASMLRASGIKDENMRHALRAYHITLAIFCVLLSLFIGVFFV